MNFISLTPTPGQKSPDILLERRTLLGLSQAEVAEGANIQLRQYQRLETGERFIESASMKTALAICAVLKLDPFVFFPDAENMNSYISTHSKDTSVIAKEDAIPQLLQKACECFNGYFHTNYSLDNIKVAYCTLENAVEVYHTFTKEFGFRNEKRSISDFTSVLAETFVGQTDISDPTHVDGILLRVDPPQDLDNPDYYMMVLVHELSHIFCITHEIETAGQAGKRFYDLYCEGTAGTPADNFNNGFINAGYAIWREMIAVLIQDFAWPQQPEHLDEITPELLALAKEVKVGNPSAKSFMHRYLSEIMRCKEVCKAENWEDIEPRLSSLPFLNVIKYVFDMLGRVPCYVIDPFDIEELGCIYITAMAQNTPPEELMKFAQMFNNQLGR